MSFEGEAIEATLVTGKQNHDQDVMTTGAAINRHGALLPKSLSDSKTVKFFAARTFLG